MTRKILTLLKKHPAGIGLQRMGRELRLVRSELPTLRRELQELQNKGLVRQVKRRYVLSPRKQLIKGEVVDVRRGYAWVRPETAAAQDIFIPARYAGGALLGDRVEVVCEERNEEERPEGKILRIIQRKRDLLIGMYKEYWGRSFFLPYESPLPEELPLLVPGDIQVSSGQIIEVDRKTRVLKRVLGGLDDPGVDVEVLVRKYTLRSRFPAEALEEAERLPAADSSPEMAGRKDFRAWKTVTIDGEDARDFDDAVSIDRTAGNRFLLGVHIADVSHYVHPGSALDREAYLRGCSVYFPETVLPMLPERLSNDICSLRPDEDRLALSVLLDIDLEGRVMRSRFVPSVIRSDARLTYSEVFQSFQGGSPPPGKIAELQLELREMRALAALLRQRRLAGGSLDIVKSEPHLLYEGNKLVGIEAVSQNEAHGMIEEFMLAANEAVATYLVEQRRSGIFRSHPPPSLRALTELRSHLLHLGITLPDPKKIEAPDLQKAQREAQGKPWERFVALRILRSLKLAVYAAENLGHFGLGKDRYLHFTSPIRRYPDLAVHRSLLAALKGQKEESPLLADAAQWSSDRERRSEVAEKDLVEWRICRFLHTRLGDIFTGTIMEITKAGLIVELRDYYLSGTILYQDLGGDYFVRKGEASISGRKTGLTFTLGDNIQVSLAAVDPELRRLTFIPA
jgi:ribonuclease R